MTTGNLAGIDLWLDEPRRGTLALETNVVSGEVEPGGARRRHRDASTAAASAGKLSVYRLPEQDWSRHVTLDHSVTFAGGADLPVYLRVTQSDGHQAWTSPIYLID